MSVSHVFVETNFLYSIFRMPSQRDRDALALLSRFGSGEVKLYLPYVCLQEANNLIAKNLPRHRCDDLFGFHRYAVSQGTATWNYEEAKKLLDAALAEMNRTKDVHKRDVAAFAAALGDRLLHGTDKVFDFLETLALDDDNATFVDKLVLCSILVRAKELAATGIKELCFASTDKDFQPSAVRPKLTQYYSDAGLTFVPGFVLPEPSASANPPDPSQKQ